MTDPKPFVCELFPTELKRLPRGLQRSPSEEENPEALELAWREANMENFIRSIQAMPSGDVVGEEIVRDLRRAQIETPYTAREIADMGLRVARMGRIIEPGSAPSGAFAPDVWPYRFLPPEGGQKREGEGDDASPSLAPEDGTRPPSEVAAPAHAGPPSGGGFTEVYGDDLFRREFKTELMRQHGWSQERANLAVETAVRTLERLAIARLDRQLEEEALVLEGRNL